MRHGLVSDPDKLANAYIVVGCIVLAGALIAVRAFYVYVICGSL